MEILNLFYLSGFRLFSHSTMKDKILYKNEAELETCLVLDEVTLIYDGKIVCYFIVMHFWVDFAYYRYVTAEFINKINCFYSFTLSFFHRNTI